MPDGAYLENIGNEYSLLVIRRDGRMLARTILQVLNKERTQLGRKLNRLHEDLAKARQAGDFRKKGELPDLDPDLRRNRWRM